MSIQLERSNQEHLVRTATVPNYDSPYTVACWVYADTIDGVVHTVAVLLADDDNVDISAFCDTNIAPTDRSYLGAFIAATGDTSYVGNTLTTSTWYYVTMIRTSTSVIEMGINGSSQESVTQSIVGRTAATVLAIGWAINGGSEYGFNGRIAAVKIWAEAKSHATLYANEAPYWNAQDTTNLWGQYHFKTATADADGYNDSSGNSRDLTAVGTLSTAGDPPAILGNDPSSNLPINSVQFGTIGNITEFGRGVPFTII